VKAHILKRARALGVEVDLGDDDGGDGDEGRDSREDREDKPQRRPRKQPRQPGATKFNFHNDGTDAWSSGGGETGGPSGQGEGGGMAASHQQQVQHMVHTARPGGGYAASEILRLTAAQVAGQAHALVEYVPSPGTCL
jgi:hypothetical protein